MKAADRRRPHPPWGKLIALLVIAAAIGTAIYVLPRDALLPPTGAATVDVDVIHVASAVGGRIIIIPVTDNMRVSKGDLLFQTNPKPYRQAVAQAEADLDIAEAALATQQPTLSTQRAPALVAQEQTERATTNLGLANGTVERLRPLATKAFVPVQQLDQAQVAEHDAETSLQQAREQQIAAAGAVDTDAGAEATVRARRAALAIARRALEDTAVCAFHTGRLVGLAVHWVRVAQRFPARVRLENLGASAVVEVKHGPGCR